MIYLIADKHKEIVHKYLDKFTAETKQQMSQLLKKIYYDNMTEFAALQD